ncbi:MAG: hypothetical protein Kow00127_10810 [Bacteroidales bacterium]
MAGIPSINQSDNIYCFGYRILTAAMIYTDLIYSGDKDERGRAGFTTGCRSEQQFTDSGLINSYVAKSLKQVIAFNLRNRMF